MKCVKKNSKSFLIWKSTSRQVMKITKHTTVINVKRSLWENGGWRSIKIYIQIFKQCKYFKNQTKCPFDKLGCKFRHDLNTEDTILINSMTLSEYSFNMLSSFYTSTPRKCEECLDKSKCVDCLVEHILGQHGVARILFSWTSHLFCPTTGRSRPWFGGLTPPNQCASYNIVLCFVIMLTVLK